MRITTASPFVSLRQSVNSTSTSSRLYWTYQYIQESSRDVEKSFLRNPRSFRSRFAANGSPDHQTAGREYHPPSCPDQFLAKRVGDVCFSRSWIAENEHILAAIIELSLQ